jgi:hypothetical protein
MYIYIVTTVLKFVIAYGSKFMGALYSGIKKCCLHSEECFIHTYIINLNPMVAWN